MSKEERKVPELRFKGFHDDWEQRKLKDILIVNSGKDYKHLSPGPIPVFGTGGYMLSVNDKLSNQDGIGLGRKGTINKPQYLNSPFWTVDTLFYLTSRDNNSLLFQYYVAQDINWLKFDESTGVPSLSKKTIENITKFIPTHDEQIKNGEFFKKLDRLITLHQRKYVNLVKLKNVYLKKIFNQQLVFEDGKNDWKEIKFNEFMYKPKNLLKAKNIGKNELLTVKLFGKGITIANQNRALKLGATTYYKRYAGDFIYGKQNFFNGAFGFIDKNLDGYYSSGDVPTLKFNSEIIDRYFFLSYISRENYYKRTEAYSSGTGSKRIHEDTLLDFKIKAPIISEQRKIANLMCEIDDLVNDYSQRLKYLSDIKSLYINKMFI